MRIIGGQHRGTHLADVGKGDLSAHLRPTSDRVRENLFNVLTAGRQGDVVADAVVLDLFAGTGALGLEALSRGATEVTFVENGRAGQKLIRQNIHRLGRAEESLLLACDATALPMSKQPADLIFMDPPYGKGLGIAALKSAKQGNWIKDGTIIVWEESSQQIAPVGLQIIDQRRYGETWITILEAV